MSEYPILVIDNGSFSVKAGLAGEDHPTAIIPTAIGLQNVNLSDPDTFSSHCAQYASGDLKVRYPISNGNVTNWDDMETIWQHLLEHHLQINGEETNVLITEPMLNPRPAREKMAEILFEKLGFHALSIATSPILPMYAVGRTTGIVLDVGDGLTQVVPIWEGYPITEAMQRVEFGGRQITQMLNSELSTRGVLRGKTSPEVFNFIKEKVCHVVPDYDHALGRESSTTEFELPNGDKIGVGEEAFKCPEFLFNPSKFTDFADTNRQGLAQLVYKAVQKSNIDVRKDMYSNIILSGGSTLFPGFVERMEKELKDLVPPSVKITINAHQARKYFTWIGGSVLASLTSFPDTLLSKERWQDEGGRQAVHRI